MSKERLGKVVAAIGNIVSVVCLIVLIRLIVVHGIVTGSVTGLQAAFAAGAAVLLAGFVYSWATNPPRYGWRWWWEHGR